MKYAVILDYSSGEVYADEITEEDNKLAEEGTDTFLSHYGFNPDECYVMITPYFPRLISFKE